MTIVSPTTRRDDPATGHRPDPDEPPLSPREMAELRALLHEEAAATRPAPGRARHPGTPRRQARHLVALALLALLMALAPLAVPLAGQAAPAALTDTCNGNTINLPFTDVAAGGFFCAIFQAFNLGITAGTTATTYSPTNTVTRDQMAAFTSRTLDNALKRGSQRAALGWWYLPDYSPASYDVPSNFVGLFPLSVASDGREVWVIAVASNTVSRVSASDASVTGTWTVPNPSQLVLALNRVFVTSNSSPGRVYRIDPSVVPTATAVVTQAHAGASGITFDGTRLWVASGISNTVAIITPTTTLPYPSSTVTGVISPQGLVYDGTAVWVTEASPANRISRLSPTGATLLSAAVGIDPTIHVFDGTNLWVPNQSSNSVSVVRAIGNSAVPTGTVVATLTGNGLNGPVTAAFDGERVLVTNFGSGATAVSLWRASDLAPLGSFTVGARSGGAASDGRSFWITVPSLGKLVRY